MTAPRTGPALAFRPHPGPQTTFLRAGDRDIFFGGAAGPGKSVCLVAAGLRRFAIPGYRAKIFRRTRKMAQELILKTNRMVKCAFPMARWNGNEHAFIHPNGGRLEIGYLRHDMDLENEEGQEYQLCGFDEICQFPEHQAKFLHSRLRSDSGMHLEYKATGNPRGVGLLWVKNHYVDPAPAMTTHWHSFKAPNGKNYHTSTLFVPGRLEDNPSVGQDYEVSLASLGNAKLYDALRHGKWDALLGDALPEWDADVHVLTWAEFAVMHGLILRVRANGEEYCEIPDYWPIYMGYDWGTAHPFSVCWYTCDDHGRMYRIYEWYGAAKTREGATIRNKGIHMATSDQARGILAREQQWGIAGRVEHRVADPSIIAGSSRQLDITGPDIQEIMADEGVYLNLANNNRKLGKTQIHERLRIAEFRNEDGTIDETPGFMCIKETCPEFLATVPILPSDPRDPEDIDKTAEAHCLTGDTLVETESGPTAIRDLAGTTGRVWSWDGERAVLMPYHDARLTQIGVQTFTVAFNDGRVVQATGNHPFMLHDGTWVRADELVSGDLVRDIYDTMVTATRTEVQDASDHCERAHAGVRRDQLLPDGQVLRQSEARQAPAPSGLGAPQRANPGGDAHSPRQPRSGGQPDREPGNAAEGRAFEASREHAGKHCGEARPHAGRYDAEGEGMALNPRGEGLAQRACQGDMGGPSDTRQGVSVVREDVPDIEASAIEVLPLELQDDGATAASRRQPDDARREVGSDAAGLGYATVKEVLAAGFADVYNFEVAETHCYAVAGGLVVHNCYDSWRYVCMSRPYRAKLEPVEATWLAKRKKRAKGDAA